jgi:electron transport complex protein RnfG
MKEAIKLSLALGIICGLAAAILAFGEWKTLEPRRKAATAQRQKALRLVLPDFANDPLSESKKLDNVTFYPARDAAGKLIGVAGEGSSTKGFGGRVGVLVSFKPDGKILHVLVTSHKETPGLGTRVTDRKRKRFIWEIFRAGKKDDPAGLPPNRYLDAFEKRDAAAVGNADFKVVKNKGEVNDNAVLAISGATISSRAVADAVSRVCAAFTAYRKPTPQRAAR